MSVFCISRVFVLIGSAFFYPFVMIWSQHSHVLMPAWIWIVSETRLTLTDDRLALFFALPSVECPFVTDVASISTGDMTFTPSERLRPCQATVISVLLYFQGFCSAINTSKHWEQGWFTSDPDVGGLCHCPCCAASAHISSKCYLKLHTTLNECL